MNLGEIHVFLPSFFVSVLSHTSSTFVCLHCFSKIVKERMTTEGVDSINNRKLSKVKSEGPTPQTNQKPSAAERIGISRPRQRPLRCRLGFAASMGVVVVDMPLQLHNGIVYYWESSVRVGSQSNQLKVSLLIFPRSNGRNLCIYLALTLNEAFSSVTRRVLCQKSSITFMQSVTQVVAASRRASPKLIVASTKNKSATCSILASLLQEKLGIIQIHNIRQRW